MQPRALVSVIGDHDDEVLPREEGAEPEEVGHRSGGAASGGPASPLWRLIGSYRYRRLGDAHQRAGRDTQAQTPEHGEHKLILGPMSWNDWATFAVAVTTLVLAFFTRRAVSEAVLAA